MPKTRLDGPDRQPHSSARLPDPPSGSGIFHRLWTSAREAVGGIIPSLRNRVADLPPEHPKRRKFESVAKKIFSGKAEALEKFETEAYLWEDLQPLLIEAAKQGVLKDERSREDPIIIAAFLRSHLENAEAWRVVEKFANLEAFELALEMIVEEDPNRVQILGIREIPEGWADLLVRQAARAAAWHGILMNDPRAVNNEEIVLRVYQKNPEEVIRLIGPNDFLIGALAREVARYPEFFLQLREEERRDPRILRALERAQPWNLERPLFEHIAKAGASVGFLLRHPKVLKPAILRSLPLDDPIKATECIKQLVPIIRAAQEMGLRGWENSLKEAISSAVSAQTILRNEGYLELCAQCEKIRCCKDMVRELFQEEVKNIKSLGDMERLYEILKLKRGNPELKEIIIKIDQHFLRIACSEFLQNRPIFLENLIKKAPHLIGDLPPEIANNWDYLRPLALIAAKQGILFVHDEVLADNEIVQSALKAQPNAWMNYVDLIGADRVIPLVVALLNDSPNLYLSFPVSLKSVLEVAYAAVERDPAQAANLPRELIEDYRFINQLLQRTPMALIYLPLNFRSRFLLIVLAFQGDPRAVAAIPYKILINPEGVRILVEQIPEVDRDAFVQALTEFSPYMEGEAVMEPQPIPVECTRFLNPSPIPAEEIGQRIEKLEVDLDRFINELPRLTEEKPELLATLRAELPGNFSIEEIQSSLRRCYEMLCTRLKDSTPHLGTPQEGTEALRVFYEQLKLLLATLQPVLAENPPPEMLLERVQILQAMLRCGAAWPAEYRQLYMSCCALKEGATLRDVVAGIISTEGQKIIGELIARPPISGDVHYQNQLTYLLKDFLGLDVLPDALPPPPAEIEALKNQFLDQFSFSRIATILQQRDKGDLEYAFISYAKEKVFHQWMTEHVGEDEKETQLQEWKAWALDLYDELDLFSSGPKATELRELEETYSQINLRQKELLIRQKIQENTASSEEKEELKKIKRYLALRAELEAAKLWKGLIAPGADIPTTREALRAALNRPENESIVLENAFKDRFLEGYSEEKGAGLNRKFFSALLTEMHFFKRRPL